MKYYENILFEERPPTANSALAVCNDQIFPAVHKILIILLTIPPWEVFLKRSFSALRRLKLWNQSTMKEERLSDRGMFLIHRGTHSVKPQPQVIQC